MQHKFFTVEVKKKDKNEKNYQLVEKHCVECPNDYEQANDQFQQIAKHYHGTLRAEDICIMAPPPYYGTDKKGKDVLINLRLPSEQPRGNSLIPN